MSEEAAEIKALFERVCRGARVPSPDGAGGFGSGHGDGNGNSTARDALVRRVYRQVHCRLPDDGSGEWASREQAAASLEHAARVLKVRPSRHHGFTGRVEGSAHVFGGDATTTLLRDSTGIEVLAPPGAALEEEPGGIVVVAPTLAFLQERRWMVWSSPGAQTPATLARLYLNARPEEAFETWLAVVRALESSGLRSHAKVATSTALCARADCVVAYAPSSEISQLVTTVRAAVPERSLDGPVAGFAWRVGVGMGVGIGRSDGDGSPGTSAGMTWSERLVTALLNGPERLCGEFDRLSAAIAAVAAQLVEQPVADADSSNGLVAR